MARSYYYTIGEPRVVKGSSHGVKGWKLSVSYIQNPESKKNKIDRADSKMKKFRMPDTPPLFLDEAEALGKQTEFRNWVEDLIRGNRPHKSHAVERTVPVPTQLANARRAIRVMATRARQCIYNARMKQAELARPVNQASAIAHPGAVDYSSTQRSPHQEYEGFRSPA